MNKTLYHVFDRAALTAPSRYFLGRMGSRNRYAVSTSEKIAAVYEGPSKRLAARIANALNTAGPFDAITLLAQTL